MLAGPGKSREARYVAMTRGRDANTAYVATDATDAADPTCDQLPDIQAERSGRDILTQILATVGAETHHDSQRSAAPHEASLRAQDRTSEDHEHMRLVIMALSCGNAVWA